jgi:hypothetical protein
MRDLPAGVKGRVVIAASVAQRPFRGGHTWVFLQYLLGFRRLGWDVLLLDRLETGMCADADGRPAPVRESVNFRYLDDVLERFGLRDSYALFRDDGPECLGLGREAALRRVAESDVLLNFMGFMDDEAILSRAKLRVFVDIDPGFGQMWRALGLEDLFARHNRFVTLGGRIGQEPCGIPTCGLEWIPTRPPVVLEEWPVQPLDPEAAFSSVATWRGDFGPIDFAGRRHGLRVHEFRRFTDLPVRTGQRFELALDIHPRETDDIQHLEDRGWTLLDPMCVAGNPDAYRAFIQHSRAEFMIAKSIYVSTRGGWFSDRSACYLASGRPVIAQDTGISSLLPTGEGLLTFGEPEEAAAAVQAVAGDPARHARAARALAEEYFDADKVLTSLLARLDATPVPYGAVS